MYGGNGSKMGIIYENETWMLKLPPKVKNKDNDLTYSNGSVSEYVACHIYQSLGIKTQETLLGYYNEKIAVICKDFTSDKIKLKDFASLKNTSIESSNSGYETELGDCLLTIRTQKIMDPERLEDFFWQMFIIDALLGNFDRHNGNWGFLVKEPYWIDTAPIYDCGSCLYPQLSETQMEYVLSNQDEIDMRIYTFPNSALKTDNKKINYHDFLINTTEEKCKKALKDINSRINLLRINDIVDQTPIISDIYKTFIKTMIKERKEKILDKASRNPNTILGWSNSQ